MPVRKRKLKHTLKIHTEPEIVVAEHNPKRGYLMIHVWINGRRNASLKAMDGSLKDIRAFVAGKIDNDEIARRWHLNMHPSEPAFRT